MLSIIWLNNGRQPISFLYGCCATFLSMTLATSLGCSPELKSQLRNSLTLTIGVGYKFLVLSCSNHQKCLKAYLLHFSKWKAPWKLVASTCRQTKGWLGEKKMDKRSDRTPSKENLAEERERESECVCAWVCACVRVWVPRKMHQWQFLKCHLKNIFIWAKKFGKNFAKNQSNEALQSL